MPTSKADCCTLMLRRASAYICQPRATLSIWPAKAPHQRDPQNSR